MVFESTPKRLHWANADKCWLILTITIFLHFLPSYPTLPRAMLTVQIHTLNVLRKEVVIKVSKWYVVSSTSLGVLHWTTTLQPIRVKSNRNLLARAFFSWNNIPLGAPTDITIDLSDRVKNGRTTPLWLQHVKNKLAILQLNIACWVNMLYKSPEKWWYGCHRCLTGTTVINSL